MDPQIQFFAHSGVVNNNTAAPVASPPCSAWPAARNDRCCQSALPPSQIIRAAITSAGPARIPLALYLVSVSPAIIAASNKP